MHRTRKTAKPEAAAPALKTPRTPAKATKPRAAARVISQPEAETIFDPSQHRLEIAEAAYYIFLERNGMSGSETEDWILAEEKVRQRHSKTMAASAASAGVD